MSKAKLRLLVVGLENEMKRALHVYAAERGLTMSDVVKQAIKKVLAEGVSSKKAVS